MNSWGKKGITEITFLVRKGILSYSVLWLSDLHVSRLICTWKHEISFRFFSYLLDGFLCVDIV